jgi:hypothetical protein
VIGIIIRQIRREALMTREQKINDIQDANVEGRFAPSPNGKRSAAQRGR